MMCVMYIYDYAQLLCAWVLIDLAIDNAHLAYGYETKKPSSDNPAKGAWV